MATKRSGFTVVELLVAMTVFAVVITIATGSFIRALRTQQGTAALIAVNDNANLTLEQMAREIRTGQNFTSPNPQQLDFTSALAHQITYRLDLINQAIERTDNGVARPITASNVKVKQLSFVLIGDQLTDGRPPRVTITLTVGTDARNLQDVTATLQTTVSSRILDG